MVFDVAEYYHGALISPILEQKKKGCRNRLRQPCLYGDDSVLRLGGASYLGGLSIDTSAVKCVVNDLSHCGDIRINIHAVTSREVTDNSLSGDFVRGSHQFRKPSRLNMVDSLQPLNQRQALVKIHDSLISL